MWLALVVAVLCIPTVSGLTAWGLAGGDGEPETPTYGVLALLVGAGSLYNALTCYLALFDIATWQWWLMWVCPLAGVLGILLSGIRGDLGPEENTVADFAVGLGFQAVAAIPAVLLLMSEAVTL